MNKQVVKDKVLLINGFDFLGRELVKELAKLNLNITLVDREITPENIREFSTNSDIEIVAYQQFIKNDLRKERYDAVIYNSLYESSQKIDLIDSLGNIKNILNKAVIDASPFYLISSVNQNLLNSKDASYKGMLTSVFEDFEHQGVKGKLLLLGEIYGPGMNLDNSSPLLKILRSAVNDQQIVLDGSELFNYYIYITDAVKGIIHSFDLDARGIFTIADPFDLSLSSLALRLSEITGKQIINKLKPNSYDHFKNLPYILPNWRPQVNIEKGLENTLTWIKETGAIKNAQNIPVNSIANNEPTQPIRNYQTIQKSVEEKPVYKEVIETPSQPQTQMPPQSQIHSQSNIRSISELKAKIGTPPEKNESQVKEVLSNVVSKIGNKAEEKSFVDYYQEEKKKGKGLYFLLSFLVLVLILISPFVIIGYGYAMASQDLSNASSQDNNRMINDANIMMTGLNTSHWMFLLTKQEGRYINAYQTAQTIKDIGTANNEFASYNSPIQTVKENFPKQNYLLSQTITKLTGSSSTSLVSTDIGRAAYDLTLYNPYFPGNIDKEKSIISESQNNFIRDQHLYTLIPSLLQGQTHYIVVFTDLNAPAINPIIVDEVSFTNGIYEGITPLQSPKTIQGANINDISTNLENAYPGQFNGVIIIDKAAFNNVLPDAQLTAANVPLFLKNFISLTTPAQIKALLSSNDIEFSFNNIELSNNDIITAVFN